MLRLTLNTLTRQLVVAVLQLAMMVVLSRTLSVEGVGLFSVSYISINLAASILSCGLSSSSVYFVDRQGFAPATILWGNLVYCAAWLGVAFIGLGVAHVGLSVSSYSSEHHTLVLWTLAALPAFLVLQVLPNLFQATMSFATFNALLVIQPFVGLILVAIGASITADPVVAVSALTCSAWLAALIVLVACLRSSTLKGPWQRSASATYLRAALRYGFVAQVSDVLTQLNYRAAIAFVALSTGAAGVAVYAIAIQIVEKLWLPSQAISTILFPHLVEDNRDGKSIFERSLKVALLTLYATGLLAFVAALILPFVMVPVFGPNFRPSIMIAWLLLPGIVLWSASRVLAHGLKAIGAVEANVTNAMITLAITLVLNLLLVPIWGVYGAAVATSITYSLDLVVRLILLRRATREPFPAIALHPLADLTGFIRSIRTPRS